MVCVTDKLNVFSMQTMYRNCHQHLKTPSKFWVYMYLGVKTCEAFLCFVAIVRVK